MGTAFPSLREDRSSSAMVSSWLSLGSVRTSPMLDRLAGSLVAECMEWGATVMRGTASAVGQLSMTSDITPNYDVLYAGQPRCMLGR